MSEPYWNRYTLARMSRRRVIAGAAAATAGVAALSMAGCGGGTNKEGASTQGPKDASGLLGQRVDASSQAVRGGTMPSLTTSDVTTFDPLTTQSFTTQVANGWVYSRILKVVPGFKEPSKRDVEGDLAESWEISPDKLQITFKLRQNARWDARAPTNSRPVSADDILFSWDKFSTGSPFRADLANAASPDAPIESMSAPDSKTLVVKLASPDSTVMPLLSSTTDLYVLPKESDGGFDPRKEMRGSSAWFLEKYSPSVGFTWARNPNWYRSDRPFLDRYDQPIVSEYAAGLAQFRAGNVYIFGVQDTDILQTKRDLPDLLMLPGNFNQLWYPSWFGYQGNSPFKDERVRQAMALSFDRDLWIDTIYNTSEYKKVGLPVQNRWHSHVSSGVEGWWVDPQDEKAFGPNSKYFKYDATEAKKLLTAAGYASGFETTATHITSSQYGRTFVDQVTIQIGFINDIGIKTKVNNPDYQTVWLNNYYYGKGAFEGFALGAENYTGTDVGAFLFSRFHPKGPRFKGFDPAGRDPNAGDPELTRMTEDIRKEFDTEKRRGIAKSIQQYLAKAMYMLPFPGQSAGFGLTWPAVGNTGVFLSGSAYGAGTETAIHLWLDKTKPPLGRSQGRQVPAAP